MKLNRKGILSAALILILAVSGWLWGLRERGQTACSKHFFAMDTFFSLKAYGPRADSALNQAEKKVQELENLFSVTKEGSDIWKINQTKEAWVPVSADTLSLIEAGLQLGEETDGALDITIYPVLREWGFTTGSSQVPDPGRIEQLLAGTGSQRVGVDERGAAVFVPEGVQLDLGSLAKGYAGDCLVDLLRQTGVTSAILDLGGNVQTLGRKPDGSLWQVAVRNPFDAGEALGILQVEDKAVVTSGNYERYFTGEDGRNYGHILNPADGYPVDNGLASVTVVGEKGVICDGLSTALFVMGREKAIAYWREKQDFEMILATEEKELYLTEGLAECFQGGDGWRMERITRKAMTTG